MTMGLLVSQKHCKAKEAQKTFLLVEMLPVARSILAQRQVSLPFAMDQH